MPRRLLQTECVPQMPALTLRAPPRVAGFGGAQVQWGQEAGARDGFSVPYRRRERRQGFLAPGTLRPGSLGLKPRAGLRSQPGRPCYWAWSLVPCRAAASTRGSVSPLRVSPGLGGRWSGEGPPSTRLGLWPVLNGAGHTSTRGAARKLGNAPSQGRRVGAGQAEGGYTARCPRIHKLAGARSCRGSFPCSLACWKRGVVSPDGDRVVQGDR